MNNSTYKTLIQNGRMQLFPAHIEDKVRDYYEYVSKRVEDNNHYLDEIAIHYYSEHHPYALKIGSFKNKLTQAQSRSFLHHHYDYLKVKKCFIKRKTRSCNCSWGYYYHYGSIFSFFLS